MNGNPHSQDLVKEETIFHAALQLRDASRRRAYLDLACDGDPALRGRMEKLLALEPDAEGHLEPFVAEIVANLGAAAGGAPARDAQLEVPEGRIGRYKLLEKIGEGGMGFVYMAEQREPVRRKVALKIIKLGMDTQQVVARFEAERQALAMMDHPNIAKILDAGVADSQLLTPDSQLPLGRPYFVMELVNGVPITEFCQANQLSLEARLELLIPVCHAIQHAHQKGIIHRDLKPSNVLVTMHNGAPHPVVIDFGVARAIDQRLTEKTLFTRFGSMIGTPAYMSPEQAELNKVDVDTRSDIYSLGVLLYELLTGTTPFPEKRLRSVAYHEMQRILLEEEPERPSTRLRKTALAGSAPTLAPRPSSLAPDLDCIVMKCLEKDRNRRYDTANGLAADLRRYLGNESILARPQTAAYRMRKWIRRHTVQFAALAVVTTTLVAASVVSTWQAVRASKAQRAFREQAETANSVKNFLVEQVLGGAVSWNQKRFDPNDRVIVERIAAAVEGRFTNQPRVEADVRDALTDGFAAFDDVTNAIRHAERALALRTAHLGKAHPDTLTSAAKVATGLYFLGRHGEADQLLDEAISGARSASQMKNSGAAELLFARGYRLTFENQHDRGLTYIREALEIFRQTLGEDHTRTSAGWFVLAMATQGLGQTNEAAALYQEGIQRYTRSLGTNDYMVAVFHKGYGLLLMQMGRTNDAVSHLEIAVAIQRSGLGRDNQFTLEAETFLSDALAMQGRTNEAIARNLDLHQRWRQYLPQDYPRIAIRNLGHFFVRHHRYPEARAAFEDSKKALLEVPPQRPDEFGDLIRATAAVEGWPAAAALCEARLDAFPESQLTWLRKAWVFRAMGNDERYREVVNRVLALPRTSIATNDQHVPIEIAGLGRVELTPTQQADLEVRIHELETGLPSRSAQLQRWGHRAIGQYQLRSGYLERCRGSLERAESAESTPDPYTLYLKALCLHRMRQGDALTALREADALLAAEPSADTPEDFLSPNRLYLLSLAREARAEVN